MIKKILNIKTILFCLSGIIIGFILFTLGDADDAPGLSAIGIGIAFLMIMRGIYHMGIIKRGHHIPIVVAVLGLALILFPIMLLFDHEIIKLSLLHCFVMVAGVAMIIIAVIRIKK